MGTRDTIALVAGLVGFFIAIISGIFTYVVNERTRDHSIEIESLKNNFNRDIERLKARLGHGQLVSSTQWNAEFSAYQQLWQSVVSVRVLAIKLVKREAQLPEIGIQVGDVTEDALIAQQHLVQKEYVMAAKACLAAIHQNAPFYPSDIRAKAALVHDLSAYINKASLADMVSRLKKQSVPTDKSSSEIALEQLVASADELEQMIRNRMSEVQVFNSAIG